MSVAPLSTRQYRQLGQAAASARATPTISGMAGRRRFVLWSKRVLPLMAVTLLATIMLWPEIARQFDMTRRSKGIVRELREGRLLNLRYHGLDTRNRPYTVTAQEAQQVTPERINLVSPKADVLSENGSWTLVVSERGVYLQHAGQLDLSGRVVVYRDNGLSLHTESAAIDLKAGAAAGNQPTHAEGPFGSLDAQGFAVVDKAATVQFDGKSRLVLNEQRH